MRVREVPAAEQLPCGTRGGCPKTRRLPRATATAAALAAAALATAVAPAALLVLVALAPAALLVAASGAFWVFAASTKGDVEERTQQQVKSMYPLTQ